MPLRALLLDFGGTLAREREPRAALYAAAGRAHGVEVDEARMEVLMRDVHAALPREIDGAFRYSDPWFRAYIARVFQEGLSFEGSLDELAEGLLATFSDARTFDSFPDATDLLAGTGGLRRAVVSNWGPRLALLLEGLGVTVDLVLSSALERLEKPDPALFQRALDRLGVAADEALHVGDRLDTDVAGARAAGIQAVLLDRSGRMSAPPDVRVVRSLAELELS
jgi:putative hydrolase of the HAD superfamily